MKILTARWVTGCIAAGSIALVAGALVLEYVDRDLLPASMTGWTFGNVSGQVVNLAVPVVGFVLASRRPANRIGWLFLAAGLVLALEAFGAQYALRALVAAPGSLPAGRAFAWVASWLGVFPHSHARFCIPALPDRAPAVPAVAPGRLVHGCGVRASRGGLACHRHPLLVGPVQLVQ